MSGSTAISYLTAPHNHPPDNVDAMVDIPGRRRAAAGNTCYRPPAQLSGKQPYAASAIFFMASCISSGETSRTFWASCQMFPIVS